MTRHMAPVMAGLLALAGCVNATPDTAKRQGACYTEIPQPDVIETTTSEIEVKPAEIGANGNILNPPVYRTETRQEIVAVPPLRGYETPCPPVFTPEFIASLQRALAVRGFYAGAIDGTMNTATRNAIRAYQKPLGIDGAELSSTAARALGLITTKP